MIICRPNKVSQSSITDRKHIEKTGSTNGLIVDLGSSVNKSNANFTVQQSHFHFNTEHQTSENLATVPLSLHTQAMHSASSIQGKKMWPTCQPSSASNQAKEYSPRARCASEFNDRGTPKVTHCRFVLLFLVNLSSALCPPVY